MNHSFVSAGWNNKICAKCAQSEAAHGNEVVCEACSNVGEVEVVGKMLLCASCQSKELAVPITEAKIEQLSIEQVVNQVNRIIDSHQIVNENGENVSTIIDEAIKGNIKEYTDFFNAKIPSIIELKNLVDEDDSIEQSLKHYALAKLLRARIQYLARVLFQTRNSQIQMGAEIKSIQEYVNKLIPELRMKMRAEFATMTPNYTPISIKIPKEPKEKKVRLNTSDRLAESYAKMMKITIEEAKRLLERKLRADCTCAETPGMCKVHNT